MVSICLLLDLNVFSIFGYALKQFEWRKNLKGHLTVFIAFTPMTLSLSNASKPTLSYISYSGLILTRPSDTLEFGRYIATFGYCKLSKFLLFWLQAYWFSLVIASWFKTLFELLSSLLLMSAKNCYCFCTRLLRLFRISFKAIPIIRALFMLLSAEDIIVVLSMTLGIIILRRARHLNIVLYIFDKLFFWFAFGYAVYSFSHINSSTIRLLIFKFARSHDLSISTTSAGHTPRWAKLHSIFSPSSSIYLQRALALLSSFSKSAFNSMHVNGITTSPVYWQSPFIAFYILSSSKYM